MTTSPVISVTDELVVELERAARSALQGGSEWYGEGCCLYSYLESSDANFMVVASPALIGALLAERAELKRDAERYRFARHNDNDCFMLNTLQRVSGDDLDAAIDAVMQVLKPNRQPHADDAAHMEIDTDSIANYKALP